MSAHADAQLLRNRGSLTAARKQFLACARQECPKLVADDCATWLASVDESLSSVVFAVSDDDGDLIDVHVTVEGLELTERTDGRALLMDPGVYLLRFTAEGHQPADLSVSVRQSEKNRIVRVKLERSALPGTEPDTYEPLQRRAKASKHGARPIPTATWVFGATTLVGAGMYAYFGLSGLSKEHDLEKLPKDQVCGALCEGGRRDYILADVGLAMAIGSAVGAVTAYLLSEPSRKTDFPSEHIALSPTHQGAQVSFRTSF